MSQLSAGFRRFSPVVPGFLLVPIPRVLGSGSVQPAAGSHFAMVPLRAPQTMRISTMAKTRMVWGTLKQWRCEKHPGGANFFFEVNFPNGANFPGK